MNTANKVGIYLLAPENGEPNPINLANLVAYAKSLQGVECVEIADNKREIDLSKISKDIRKHGIDRLILVGDTPGIHRGLFKRAMADAGQDPRNVSVASFREHRCSTPQFIDHAKGVIAAAVRGAPFLIVARAKEVPTAKETLVIGGGIAGIQASLEIANAGYKVVLLEKTGTIGGHMATFDKTFPTLDCAACILTPKMVEVGQHPNIRLWTRSEVLAVSGDPGNYKVKILKRTRYVDESLCIGCNICSEKCPVKVPSEFDAGIATRKAIYVPFPQAVPNKWLVDPENCIYHLKGKCRNCEKYCPVPNCVNLDAKDQEVELVVGNIVIATGFKLFDAERAKEFGYGLPNVLTSLQFERLTNAAGPTDGHIRLQKKDSRGNMIFSKDGEQPKSVAIIHCVGSRDRHYNRHCSRVCCMYSLKFAHLVQEKLPDVDVYEYYIDIRAFGKGYDEFYERIKHEGVNAIRGRTAEVVRNNGNLRIRGEDILNGRLIEQNVDMVILSVGLEPGPDGDRLAKILGIRNDGDGWFAETHSNADPIGTDRGGIYVAGACQGPKDIPDSVAQGAAAASRVLQNLSRGTVLDSRCEVSLETIEAQAKAFIA